VRVAIAHEWLVRYAGSEQCVAEMLRLFPDARLLTTLLRADALPHEFARAEPSFLQRVPGATSRHEWFLPLMPIAWQVHRVRDVDVVISSSHACANAVGVAPGIPHLSYCHTPMRYAWDFAAEAGRFPTALRPAARVLMGGFRRWDRKVAERVTRFVANSSAVASRIERFYGRRATVVHPPVRTEFFTPGGDRGDEFLYVGRLVGYKRADLAVEAVRDLPHRLLVVGGGADEARLRREAPPNVTFLGSVPDEELRRLYRSARAVLAPGVEDFGIAMAEAQACGTPVIAAGEGGAADIVVDGTTGWLVPGGDLQALRRAVMQAAVEELDPGVSHANAQRFSREHFREALHAEVLETLRGKRASVTRAAA
jgi:glycosyltransferase involved in cell wall biosynthesis